MEIIESVKDRIKKEIDALAKKRGLLHPEDVVDFAKNHKTSELHRHFEWDDSEAAEKYRLVQARALIRVCVVSSTQTSTPIRCMVSLSSDRKKGGGYRTIETVLTNETLHKRMLADALMEFNRSRVKYSALKELQPVFDAIDDVQLEMQLQPEVA